jgi:hypothetical protein
MHDGRSAITVRNRGAVGRVTKMLDRCRYAVTVSTIFVSTLLRRPPPRGLPHLPRSAHASG